MIMKLLLHVFLTIIFIIVISEFSNADTVYPNGYDITCHCEVNAVTLIPIDTLVLTQTIVNHESFPLTGLYFSGNLPPDFTLVDASATLNSQPVSYETIGPVSDQSITGYNNYQWIIDFPDDTSSIQNTINPDDSLTLKIRTTCQETGNYTLPFHSLAFYGNSTGFFSIADEIEIKIVLSLDVDENPDIILPDEFLISSAFPNPFNGEVTISYQGENIKNKKVGLTVYNLLGRKVYYREIINRDYRGSISWQPTNGTASGFYLYRLSTEQAHSDGKLLYIK